MSPTLVARAHARGYEATSLRDRGLLHLSDHELVKLAFEESFVLVTRNGRDFRKLLQAVELQPGIVSLQTTDDDFSATKQADIFDAALSEADSRGDLVNLDVDVVEDGGIVTITVYALPPL